MRYNFDLIVNRQNTDSVKYDLRGAVFGNPDVIPMWVADMDFETPDFVREAIRRRADNPIYGYTFRSDAYHEAIAGWLLRRHGWKVDKEWMSFSPGIVCAINMAVLSLTELGDEIIIQTPVYPPFHRAATDHGRKLISNPLVKTDIGYEVDYELLERQASTAKMLILCNPHNPVGRAWRRDELQRIGEICLRHGVLVLSDEIHCDLVMPGHRHTPYATLGEDFANNAVVMHAASKTFNLAGLSTATVIIPNESLRRRYTSFMHSTEADMGNLFGKEATQAAMLHGDEWLEQLIEYVYGNMCYVASFLEQELPIIKFFMPQATYMMWLDFSGLGLDEDTLWHKLTKEAGLGFNRGSDFGAEGLCHFRVNLACPRATVEEAMRRLKATFSGK